MVPSHPLPGVRQRVARGLPARRATQLALHPLTDLRLLEAGESEGARRAGSEGQLTCQHAVAPLRRRRGDYVGGLCQGAAESRRRMQVGQKGAARLSGAIVVLGDNRYVLTSATGRELLLCFISCAYVRTSAKTLLSKRAKANDGGKSGQSGFSSPASGCN